MPTDASVVSSASAASFTMAASFISSSVLTSVAYSSGFETLYSPATARNRLSSIGGQ